MVIPLICTITKEVGRIELVGALLVVALAQFPLRCLSAALRATMNLRY